MADNPHTFVPTTAAQNMAEIYQADERLLYGRLMAMTFKYGPAYREPLHHQVTSAARLADKAADEWSSARSILSGELETDASYFRQVLVGTDELEDFICTLAKLVKVHERVIEELGPRPGTIVTGHPSDQSTGEIPEDVSERIRLIRNRLIHGDEDVADGHAGNGFPTGSLAINEFGVEIQAQGAGSLLDLSFEELAATLSSVRCYLLHIIQNVPASAPVPADIARV